MQSVYQKKKRVLLEQAQVRMESLGNDDVSTVYAPKGWLRRRKYKIPKGTAWVDFMTTCIIVKS